MWFGLANRWQWQALLAACLAAVLAGLAMLRAEGRFPYLRQAITAMPLIVAAGCVTAWTKSELAGAPAIDRPMAVEVTGTVLERKELPAKQRIRLLMTLREPGSGRVIRARLNMDSADDRPEIAEGARLRMKARLMPPAPPMLPGGYNFARTAWFGGISATGSVLGKIEVLHPGRGGGGMGRLQERLSRHIRERLDGSSGAIAAALASGNQGAIAEADAAAMRDAGLVHLLSISGLHVSAAVGAVYLLALRLLALWPWLALRLRLPLVAAGAGAGAGIFYTLLTGAEVPTVRSCIGAVLVLLALALGRDPLSPRMLAVAAFFVMLFWPEAVVGPSFQLSFAAVIAIVALHGSEPVRAFLAPREEGLAVRGLRQLSMLLLTGIAIELALMPIGLFHFHRAGIYGAFANVIAIPLTTFATMPLIAVALLLDIAGAGGPAWWLTGKSIDAMLALAHWTAAQPGAVAVLPAMGRGSVSLFVMGGLWLALWRGKVRLLGLPLILTGSVILATLRPPDILVTGDGRQVGITGERGDELLVLRESRSEFTTGNLMELSGMSGAPLILADRPGARCGRDFCTMELLRGGRVWRLLMSRGRDRVEERALAAACDRADIVVSDRWLPRSCRPSMLKADRALLERTGGLAIDLGRRKIRTVTEDEGEHGWWRPPDSRSRRSRVALSGPSR